MTLNYELYKVHPINNICSNLQTNLKTFFLVSFARVTSSLLIDWVGSCRSDVVDILGDFGDCGVAFGEGKHFTSFECEANHLVLADHVALIFLVVEFKCLIILDHC